MTYSQACYFKTYENNISEPINERILQISFEVQ